MTTRALVLGGGGITGIAWETGLLAGLAEAGLDLTTADRVIGTSAGSLVGSQVTGSTPLEELYARQLLPPATLGDGGPGGAPLASIGVSVTLRYGVAMLRARGDLEAFGRILGERSIALAAAGRTPSVAERYEQVRRRLTESEWPDRDLRIVAVDAHTGERVVFGGPSGDPSGVSLEDAVNASCAVPLVYPPIPISGPTGDRAFVDGGVHSTANADLATGCEVVVALCPLDRAIGPLRSAGQQLEALGSSSGVRHLVVQPDATSREAIGGNVLDPEARPPSARAGHAQAVTVLEELRALWS